MTTTYVILTDEDLTEEEMNIFNAAYEAALDKMNLEGVEFWVRSPRRSEAPGIYDNSNGQMQILGYTYKVSEDIQEATNIAWESAFEALEKN